MSGPPTGAHIGAKIGAIMHEARVAAAAKIIPAETQHRADYHRAFMESVESDLAPTMRAMFQEVYDHPDCPEQAKAFLGPMLAPEHQGQFFLTVLALLGIGLAGPAAAAAGWSQRLQNASFHAHGELHLSPAEAALAVVKGAAGHDAMADEARYAGMTRDIFNGLVTITGEPPGPQQLAEALRRGYIDQERFEHGIRQSRVRNEWVDVMTRLRYAPPSPGQVLAGAIEGHLSEGDARRRLAEAGIDPENYPWLFETAGRPPGIQELIELWRRGDTDQATVEQAIRESDIKTKYVPTILKFRRHVPPARTVVAMLREGAIDDGKARQLLEANGVMGTDADDMIRGAHSGRARDVKEVTAAEALAAYTEGLIDRGSATAQLVALHYSGAAADELLNLSDRRRENHLKAATAARIRANYVAHKIDRQTAMGHLDAAGMDSATRDHALDLWTLERGTNVRHLTEAQVVKAWKAGLIDDGGFLDRHVAMGYTADDAALLLELDRT